MNEHSKHQLPLRSLAAIYPGYPFRGKLPGDKDGAIAQFVAEDEDSGTRGGSAAHRQL